MSRATVLLVALLSAPHVCAQPAKITVSSNGRYDVAFASPAFSFGGDLGVPVNVTAERSREDAIGIYFEVAFDYTVDTLRHASIRAYFDHHAVMFLEQCESACMNAAPFPSLSRYPKLPYHFTAPGLFSIGSFTDFASEGPWLYFDGTGASFLLSPAANYLTANTWQGPGGELTTGISSQIAALPGGFSHQTLLVVESGINSAFETWGQSLMNLGYKTRSPNNRGAFLNKLGYWTDNGASYYYATEPGKSFWDTLVAVKSDFDQHGIPLGYMQLDSWFYPKGPRADWSDGNGGMFDYYGALALFPPSLLAFQQALGIPLATHARWIDAFSPLRSRYRMSLNVATDPAYWQKVAAYMAASGIVTYEQDWLGVAAHTDMNLTDPYDYLDNMAGEMSKLGLTIQYCMATAGQFLQTTNYNSVTNVRVSEDVFGRNHWGEMLYGSRIASAIGLWPFSDVFKSSETDNLLLATLSAGPMGIGDRAGTIAADNLRLSIRGDGVIVKPDVPIVPLDSSYINDAQGLQLPMVAFTYSDFGALRTYYVFAYSQQDGTALRFGLPELGIHGRVYVYNYFSGLGSVSDPSDVVTDPLTNGRAYYVIAPLGPSGIALLGDHGQFVSLGKSRVAALTDDGTVHVTLSFAAGETSRTIFGYAPTVPAATASSGGTGTVTYDAVSRRFAVDVSPGPDGTAIVDIAPGS